MSCVQGQTSLNQGFNLPGTMMMKAIQMLQDLSPNSIVAEFDGPSRLSEFKAHERRAEITLCIVGFVLISIHSSNLNMVLQHARAIYFLPCPSLADKK